MDSIFCDVTFTQPSSFYRHLYEVHWVGKKERPKCTLGYKTFSRPDHLLRHYQIQHTEEMNISPQTFSSQNCTKSYGPLDHLRHHEKKQLHKKKPQPTKQQKQNEERLSNNELFDLIMSFVLSKHKQNKRSCQTMNFWI